MSILVTLGVINVGIGMLLPYKEVFFFFVWNAIMSIISRWIEDDKEQ
ncbi:hypothetical protein J2T13_003422 [Paenibacillus sp. DS2015]